MQYAKFRWMMGSAANFTTSILPVASFYFFNLLKQRHNKYVFKAKSLSATFPVSLALLSHNKLWVIAHID